MSVSVFVQLSWSRLYRSELFWATALLSTSLLPFSFKNKKKKKTRDKREESQPERACNFEFKSQLEINFMLPSPKFFFSKIWSVVLHIFEQYAEKCFYVYDCRCKTVGAWYAQGYSCECAFLYLLILSDSLLLLLDSSEFQCVRSVPSWDDIVLRPVCAADLTARPCGFVYVSARRARPTLRHRVVLLVSAFSWD